MRIRTIKPEFFLHEEMAELKPTTRLAYIGLWCAADREGRFEWRPKRLKVQILPWEKIDFEQVMNELLDAGFIVKYMVGNEIYGCIPSFNNHQHINQREAQSAIPAPEDGVQARESMCMHVQARVEGKGKEGKGKEGVSSVDVWEKFPRLDTPAMRQAWEDKQRHRKEKGLPPLKEISITKQFDIFAKWGVDTSIAAINESIANNYQGIFEPKNNANSRSKRDIGTCNDGAIPDDIDSLFQ